MRIFKKRAYMHGDEYYYQIVRKNIRKHRLKQGLTQQDLADMTDMSREYICDIENESRNKHVTIATLGRIAEALGVKSATCLQNNRRSEHPNMLGRTVPNN